MSVAKDLCKILDCCEMKILYNGLDNSLTEFDRGELQESLNDKNSTCFNERIPEVFCEYDIESIRLKSSTMLSHVIIGLTDNCNLRCKYCGYQDTRYKNGSSLKDMDEITFMKALDFIIAHSADAYETTVSFYGGEPLLQFDFIKLAIEYLEEKNYKGHKYNYRITTNGILLDLEIADYFVNKGVTCAISLDGPVFIHDRYRVYGGGKPTYGDVIKNLKRIARKYPIYYEKNIQFQAVVSPPYDRSIPKDYFDRSEVRFMDCSIGDHFSELLRNECGLEAWGSEFNEMSKTTPLRAGDMSKEDILKIIKRIIPLKKYMGIGEKNLRSSIFPSGFCTPLVTRIYIGTNGKISLCERVDEGNSLFHLGDVATGYDFDKIALLYEHTNSILAGNCNRCWAFRFCGACFNCLDKVKYDGDFCKKMRHEIERDIIDFLEFKFYNKRFDEIMQSISVG
jgi:uncharacterized protein